MAQKLRKKFFDFSAAEIKIFRALNTPQKVQDFINALQINYEEDGDTYRSPREVLRLKKAHCAEAALLAAVILWYHRRQPLLLDLKTTPNDTEHVVALFRQHGHWGAISKTNHAVLRYREPVYKTVRELALSYFHEYFLNSGKKTLRSYSAPFDLARVKNKRWLTDKQNLWNLIERLDRSKHFQILSRAQVKNLRQADAIEIAAGKLLEQKRKK